MAELKYIPFYPGYMEDTSDLSDSEFRRLMYALCAYCVGAEQPEPLTGKEVIAYRFITRNIKVSQEQYNAKCRKNSENAKKRTIANDSERKRSQANDSQTSQYKEQRTKYYYYDYRASARRLAAVCRVLRTEHRCYFSSGI
uniref:DUF6291 domain-containing protein n=1 Tax=Ackermannviridae sp. TaxID=2831612 RepID=A0A8S5RU81_9CAUD|nr:MAG TPA: hypothetical protein [Ackermannviridae sp.]